MVYQEPARSIPVFANVDVLVLGAGPAGVSAAISAATAVFLVEIFCLCSMDRTSLLEMLLL